ncbi:vesicular, overexpressed in cancer, prosurvival protein 1 isoform X4 [Tympanuchus pallidicinctus]|uniref:vesicular, overexpressed in cancer, prosurvival protein 1 isoform X3 n=1 Tax=Lagopus muta TaxID=64668 RepID=UPI00209FECB0|nr:vesicular, overexpressed in cancer, prosurvival protein 1 isoform X3 [Lagopus muta]XP_052554986.1 vesicular, overexpressed in cancer, prosurvival protein 1 isoform X4 [Tympanuchus pallidicinctus]
MQLVGSTTHLLCVQRPKSIAGTLKGYILPIIYVAPMRTAVVRDAVFLLMMGVLFCCGAGFFIRRRMYPPPLVEEPTFNVSYTRQPVNTASGSQQPGVPYYTDPGGPVMNPMAMAFHVQPNSPQGNPVYPPPPSYCNTPPPPYEQVVKSST